MPVDGGSPLPEVAAFGRLVERAIAGVLAGDLVGVYFVGSVALGGYVPGESDVDIAVVSESALTEEQKHDVASAVLQASRRCPARGLELTLYRREVASSPPGGADFEVNVNGGPRMATAVHLDADAQPGFWYVLDRAIAHRAGVVVSGPPPRTVFADVPRKVLLDAMHGAFQLRSEHVVWARDRWPDAEVIDAAVARRRGERATLEGQAVEALLSAVAERLRVTA